MTAGQLPCPSCGAEQGWKPCVACYNKIARKAKRCNECNSVQGWWRVIKIPETTLALLTALTAVVSTAITPITNLLNRHSNTVVTFVGADPNYLYADVTNSGRSNAVLRNFWLRFGELPFQDTQLLMVVTEKRDARRIVPANGELHLTFEIPGLQSKIVEKRPSTCNVTLEVEVQESNGQQKLRSDVFNTSEIADLITRLRGPFLCSDNH